MTHSLRKLSTTRKIDQRRNRLKSRRWQPVALIALPGLVIVLSALDWIRDLLRSGFWADDFLSLTTYNDFHNIFNVKIDQGQYVLNVFWALGIWTFGSGSAIPYLLLNSAIFASGLLMWMLACRDSWPGTVGWWIAGLLLANGAWLPIPLWTSNVTHSTSFLGLGAAMLCHKRTLSAGKCRTTIYWSLAGAAAWVVVVACDPLYIGVVALGAYCGWGQRAHFRKMSASHWFGDFVLAWNILPPILYFLLIGYPEKTSSATYSGSGLRFIWSNLHFYHAEMASSLWVTAIYLLLIVVTTAAVAGSLRRHDYFPIACVGAGAIMVGIILTESHQRFLNYTVMPLLLILSSCAAGGTTWFRSRVRTQRNRRYFLRAVLVVPLLSLVLLYSSGNAARGYFNATPYGGALTTFRDEVSSLAPKGAELCIVLDLPPADAAELKAEMAGNYGFFVAPIGAAADYLEMTKSQCPPFVNAIVDVRLEVDGEFGAANGAMGEPLPVMKLVRPLNGATSLKGDQVIDAIASEYVGVARVEFRVTGGRLKGRLVGTATFTEYGWISSWNTTRVANGTYTLRSVAYNVSGGSRSSAALTVRVAN